jgi:hypothetical protein
MASITADRGEEGINYCRFSLQQLKKGPANIKKHPGYIPLFIRCAGLLQ